MRLTLLLLMLWLACHGAKGQPLPVLPSPAVSLEFDATVDPTPPPWYRGGTNWDNLSDTVRQTIWANVPCTNNCPTMHVFLWWVPNTNTVKYPGVMIWFRTNVTTSPRFSFDLVDHTQTNYEVTYYITNTAWLSNYPMGFWESEPWCKTTPGVHNR